MIATLSKHRTNLKASLVLSGSKSESNRLLILQALYPSITIDNLSTSDDTKVLQEALSSRKNVLDIHHAGTAMRFLTAYLSATTQKEVVLTGSKRMQERPIGLLVNALRDLGAVIEYKRAEGYPPIKIAPATLGNKVTIQAHVSSQYISALLLIASQLEDGLTITLEGAITSRPYIEMTLALLHQIGVSSLFEGQHIQVMPCKKDLKKNITVESDWSSVSYFYSCVALSKNESVTLSNFKENSLQGDAALVNLYEKLGVTTTRLNENTIVLSKNNETIECDIKVDLTHTPDIAQTLAITCFGLGVACELTGLHTLKIKETDRLLALQEELTKFSASVRVTNDTLILASHTIDFNNITDQITIQTYQDHRMAMAFAPLANLVSFNIEDPMVVTKSYPNFYKDLEKIGIKTEFSES